MRIARIVYYVVAVIGLLLLVLWSVAPKFHGQHDVADIRSMYFMVAVAVVIVVDIVCFKGPPRRLLRRTTRKGR